MKKIVILFLVGCFLSCGSSKVVRQAQKTIKGNWTLSSVTYNTLGAYEVTLLGDATKACFESSTWQFIPNDSKGIYTIPGSECTAGDRYFKFDIQEIDPTTGLYDFLLKPTDVKYKSSSNQGFRLKLTLLTEAAMQWQQTVRVEGKPFIINMNFTK